MKNQWTNQSAVEEDPKAWIWWSNSN